MARKKRESPYKLNKHHRVPRSKKGTNDDINISVVRQDLHRAYHLLFGVHSPEEIAHILNDVWIDPHKKLVVVPEEDYYLIQQIVRRRT